MAICCGPSDDPRRPCSGPDPAAGAVVPAADVTALAAPVATGHREVADIRQERPAESQAPIEKPTSTRRCPMGMAAVDDFCIDLHEAPNRLGAEPLVMYSFGEAERWCGARGKRLCFDDEWTRACAGEVGLRYPYGNQHEPARCNDAKSWRIFEQSTLDGWPLDASLPAVQSLDQLIASAAADSAAGRAAAEHVWWLYQADPSAARAGCLSADGVFDLCGNVEEWTRRRDGGGGPDFSGSLKGRYWAEARGCAAAVTSHGDTFRFYEVGFRCCAGAR
jgi:hypothetical protein